MATIVGDGYGLDFHGTVPSLVINGNLITDNPSTGLIAEWAGGIAPFTISNNTLYNNGAQAGVAAGAVTELYTGASPEVVANNIIYDTFYAVQTGSIVMARIDRTSPSITTMYTSQMRARRMFSAVYRADSTATRLSIHNL